MFGLTDLYFILFHRIKVLSLFASVSVHSIFFVFQFLLSDLPQDSVLGPLVFTMYTFPLVIIGQWYRAKYHVYDNSAQLFISLDPDNELILSSSFNNLEHCIADIRLWMTQT